MAEFSISATSPLGGARHEYDGIIIAEITGQAIVSIATPNGGEAGLKTAFKSAYGIVPPPVGETISSAASNTKFLGLQPGQMFAVFQTDTKDPVAEVAERLNSVAYLTDQSDSWVMIEVSGKRSRQALERICPIDLHRSVFTEKNVARTMMEHMAAIITCEGPDRFVLLSPRSSARSFEHALKLSARNIS